MKKTVSPMIFVRKTFAHKTGLRCGASALALSISLGAVAMPAHANPLDGSVVAGSATISQEANLTTINQSSDRAIIDWRSFSVQKDETTQFNQPSVRAITVNRVTGNDLSAIYGNLRAIGTVVLVNPNGVLFGSTGRVDVGGLIATVNDIDANSFMSGNSTLRFISGQNGQGSIVNEGAITLKNAGLSAFVAPHVRNSGVITASLGQVALGSGNGFTVDLYGDGLLSFAPDQGLGQALSADTLALIENAGTITATRVLLSAEAAQSIVNQSINLSGVIRATSANGRGGVIQLSGSGAVRIEKDAVLSAPGAGSIDLKGGTISTDGAIIAEGGTIALKADGVMLGGTISASGRSGGSVSVDSAGLLSLADTVQADGQLGAGGSVTYKARRIIENSGSNTSASGLTSGGTITVAADSKLVSSGRYFAKGTYGVGGKIDLTADDIRLLSASFSASGRQQGGLVRIGGAFQGGKTPDVTGSSYNSFIGRWGPLATLQTASQTLINDTTLIDVSSAKGRGGTAIIWSDQRTTFLGAIDGRGASGAGSAEISSAGDLRQAELNRVNLGAGGHLLLDPKNIIIGTPATVQSWAYQGVIGSGFSNGISPTELASKPVLASAVALNGAGDRMAVGNSADAGAAGSTQDSGAVYLFSFNGTTFSGARLEAIVGKGYTGLKNVDVPQLEALDKFGFSVALNDVGDRLAVGAIQDDGPVSAGVPSGPVGPGSPAPVTVSDTGAAYLFSFTDGNFSGGTRLATIGKGYTGGQNYDLTRLDDFDNFGSSVALNGSGNRLAVGAYNDAGFSNSVGASGAVYLFTLGESSFSTPELKYVLGNGYAGLGAGSGVSLTGVELGEQFGAAVALNAAGDRLAVGSPKDNGIDNTYTENGAVYRFEFSNTSFQNPVFRNLLSKGASGSFDTHMSDLRNNDRFGSSVAFNASGSLLAVGAPNDDGFDNNTFDSGAVYLIEDSFPGVTGLRIQGTIGKGYTGGKNVNLSDLESPDGFGSSIALNNNGDRLAVLSPSDDGYANGSPNYGALHLFSFSDAAFSNGALQATIGKGYSGTKNVNLSALGSSDIFGKSVALNAAGDRLAVGAMADDGFNNTRTDSGAVYLYSFTDSNFSGGSLKGIIGAGYTGSNNIGVLGLDANERFGSSVALNADGDRLAVGAEQDRGSGNIMGEAGAVYLFSFSDNSFNGGQYTATIGKYYSGPKDIPLPSLDNNEYFGSSVALNADGNRLAVGASLDDGSGLGNSFTGKGAVYLFSFTDNDFSGGTLKGRIGKGYSGTSSLDLTALDDQDYFGGSVALNAAGDRLAVGATGDDGFGNAPANERSGAVYLFSFSDTDFTGPTLQATIGKGYTGSKNLDLSALESLDLFGSSVALNADGDRLAVGAQNDDGALPGGSNTGAAYLFSFSDRAFSASTLRSTIGKGYTGIYDVNLTQLEDGDNFGSSVALNAAGNRLAVGARDDDGLANGSTDSGSVYLFTATNVDTGSGAPVSYLTYGDSSGQTVNVSASGVVAQVAAGTIVELQASNDITVSDAITVTGSPTIGGALNLYAGRSILINANISIQSGDLTLQANTSLSHGVIDSERDAGAAVISMAAGTSINAGIVDILIRTGEGKTHLTSGDITLRNITANSIKAVNSGPTAGSGIVLASGALSASGTDTAIELVGDDFTNTAGASALSAANGRWLVWSDNPASDNRGGLVWDFKQYNATHGTTTPAYSESNFTGYDGFLYSVAPVVTISPTGTVTKVYDRTTTADLSGLSAPQTNSNGAIDGDSVSFDFSAATGTYDTKNVGSGKAITVSGIKATGTGQFGTVLGYQVTTPSLVGAITAKPLSVTGTEVLRKTYDRSTSATLNRVNARLDGLIVGDTVDLDSSLAIATFDTPTAGLNKWVTVSGFSVSGTDAANYAFTPSFQTLAHIDRKGLAVTGITVQDKVYDGSYTSGALEGEAGLVGVINADIGKVALTGTATGLFDDENVGENKGLTVTGYSLQGLAGAENNYSLNLVRLQGKITARTLTAAGITANNKTYDGNRNATFSVNRTRTLDQAILTNKIEGDEVRIASITGDFASKTAGYSKVVNVRNIELTGADSRNYYISPYFAVTADIEPKALTVTGLTVQDKIYDGSSSAIVDVMNARFSGVVEGDTVNIVADSVTGQFSDNRAGDNRSVTLSGLGKDGADASNYGFAPLNLVGNIKPRDLTVTGITANSREYDGSISANLNLTDARLSGEIFDTGLNLVTSEVMGVYSDKNVGTNKDVTVSQFGLNGVAASNYRVANFTTQADITARPLEALGITANKKTYDGKTDATFSVLQTYGLKDAILNNKLLEDDVYIASVTGAFENKNVNRNQGKTVNVTSVELAGEDSKNYTIQQTFSLGGQITAKALTVTGITVQDKTYDQSKTATVDMSNARLNGIVDFDMVSIVADAVSGQFSDKRAEDNKSVTLSGLGKVGADASNYDFAPLTLVGNIKPRDLTVTGITASNKVYDGNRDATLNVGVVQLNGKLAGDDVNVDTGFVRGTFDDKSAGKGLTVRVSGLWNPDGIDAANYRLIPVTTTADIDARVVSVSGIQVKDKTFDRTTTARLDLTSATLNGIFANDKVSLNTDSATGTFADNSVGMGKLVTVSGLSLIGDDAVSYKISVEPILAEITADVTEFLNQFQSTIDFDNQRSIPKDDYTALIDDFGTTGSFVPSTSLVITSISGTGGYTPTRFTLTFASGNFNLMEPNSNTIPAAGSNAVYIDTTVTNTVQGGSQPSQGPSSLPLQGIRR